MEASYKRSVLALFVIFIFLLSCIATISLLNNFALQTVFIDDFTLSRIKTLTWPVHLVSSIVVAIIALYTLLAIRRHPVAFIVLLTAIILGVGEIFIDGTLIAHIAHYILSLIGVVAACIALLQEVAQ